MQIRFELADEVPEDGVSDGLALVGKALARPGHAMLYQCEQWIVFTGVCKPVLPVTCTNSRQVYAYGCWGHSLLMQCSGKVGGCAASSW